MVRHELREGEGVHLTGHTIIIWHDKSANIKGDHNYVRKFVIYPGWLEYSVCYVLLDCVFCNSNK